MNTLSTRALNRTLLTRQHLVERVAMPVADMVEHLVGMQAQAPLPPYFGLWSRLADFRPADLSAGIVDRGLVRGTLMRGTLHLVTARDYLAARPVLQGMLDKALLGNFAKRLGGLTRDELAAAGRAAVTGRAATPAEIGRALLETWPDGDPGALSTAARMYVPMVQVPPRGLWGSSGQAQFSTVEDWLGRSVDADTTPDGLVLRYLAAFGPATTRDIQAWSWLTGIKAIVDRLRPRLRTFRSESGAELFDVLDAPLPDPDLPVRPRLVAAFDNLILSHADRSRILSDDHRQRIFTVNGQIPATVLIDGFVAGTWKLADGGLVIDTFGKLRAADKEALEAEGAGLLGFAEAGTTKVEFSHGE
ncbi:winged helix DNA-binding domain-containing protein [Longispora sp. K20-0274]|uniref:winged helix DNA-binding domain-containing protein n=1 Tax=Longispora sp. K20-0274 TaxID=3088255 RepID=UPI00399B9AE9